MKHLKLIALALLIPSVAMAFPRNTNTENFVNANLSFDYTNFTWNWSGYDDQVLNLNSDYAYTGMIFRLTRKQTGPVFLDVTNGVVSGQTNYLATIVRTSLPPNNVYFAELLGYESQYTNVPGRSIAKGKVQIHHSLFENQDQSAWTNPLANALIGPPLHTLTSMSNWPFTSSVAFDESTSNNVKLSSGLMTVTFATNYAASLSGASLFTNSIFVSGLLGRDGGAVAGVNTISLDLAASDTQSWNVASDTIVARSSAWDVASSTIVDRSNTWNITGSTLTDRSNQWDLAIVSNQADVISISNLTAGAFTHCIADGLSSNRQTINFSTDGNAITGAVNSTDGAPLVYFWGGRPVSYAMPSNLLMTAGATNNLQISWVYATSNAILVADGDKPTGEVAILFKVGLLDAADVQDDEGPTLLQRWTEMVGGPNGRGMLSHIGERIRTLGAKWQTGMAANVRTNVNGAAEDDVFVTMDAGTAYQLHLQNVTAVTNVDASAEYHILNDPSGIKAITNLNQISVDANGVAVLDSNNARFNVQVIGFAPSGSTNNIGMKIGLNLSTDQYSTEAAALADSSAFSVLSVDKDLESTAVWLATLTLRRQTAGSGTWTTIITDRRGFPLFTSGGGSSASAAASVFSDSSFRVFDDGDSTKLLALEVSEVSTATTRTWTVPNQDGTFVTTNQALVWNANQTVNGVLTVNGTNVMLQIPNTNEVNVWTAEQAINADLTLGASSAIHRNDEDGVVAIWGGAENGPSASVLAYGTNSSNGDLWLEAGRNGGDIEFYLGGTQKVTIADTGNVDIDNDLNVDGGLVVDLPATNKLTTTLTGNVGIGIDASTQPLHVASDGVNDKIRLSRPGGGQTVDYGLSSTECQISSTEPIVLRPGNAESVRLLENGNVGFSVTSPTQVVDVAGTVKADAFDVGSGSIFYSNGPSDWAEQDFSGGAWVVYYHTNSAPTIRTNTFDFK